jgi:hypothetical protein
MARNRDPSKVYSGAHGKKSGAEENGGGEAEDAVAGDFEVPIRLFFMEQLVFLSATDELFRKISGIQQETQTVCPLKETGFLARRMGRPKCCSICR